MKRNVILLVVLIASLLSLSMGSFAAESQMTLEPGNNYVIEGIKHIWDESVYGPKPDYNGFPIYQYNLEIMNPGASYDIYKKDNFSNSMMTASTGPIELSYEYDQISSMLPNGKTYVTVNSDSKGVTLKYRTDLAKITKISSPALFQGILQTGKTYEFKYFNPVVAKVIAEYPSVIIEIQNDAKLFVNSELREVVVSNNWSNQIILHDYMALLDNYYDETGELIPGREVSPTAVTTIISVPETSPAVKFIAPGENFTKYVTFKEISNATANSPSSWAVEFITKAKEYNLIPTVLQTNYTQASTRAEFCALAVEVYESVNGEEIVERMSFDDTQDINVQKMGGLGVVSGVGNNKFAPDATITREQAATLLSNLMNALGHPIPDQASTFADNSSISSWAVMPVGKIQSSGIMSGVGNNKFAPGENYTREQSIVTLLKVFYLTNKAGLSQ